MKSSLLILSVTILFVVSSVSIAFIVNRNLDPNFQKNWFAIGFVSLSSDAPDFILENHTPEHAFRYSITSGGKTLTNEPIDVTAGQTVSVHPDNTDLPKPYTISVFPENDTKKSESLTRK